MSAAPGPDPRDGPAPPDPRTLVRPYTLTRGRTAAADAWPPETVVSATAAVPAPRPPDPTSPDHGPPVGGRSHGDRALGVGARGVGALGVGSRGDGASDDGAVAPEARAIVEAAMPWGSLAEIAAGTRLPLGVVRVLVTDLADAGLVRVHRPGTGTDTDQLERALRGLRARIRHG